MGGEKKPSQWLLPAILLALSAFCLIPVPILSLASRLVLFAFLIGYIARGALGFRRWALFESLVLSLAITAGAGMVLGAFFPVGGIGAVLVMLAIAWALLLLGGNRLEPLWEKGEEKALAAIFLFSSVPLALMLLLNPNTGFISDGWLHCSILNTLPGQVLPPENPWLAGAMLSYPYAYHIFLTYAFGGELFCLQQFGIYAVFMMFAQALGVYALLMEFGGKKIGRKGALSGAFVFTWATTIGGIALLWDLAAKLPALGLQGYLAFLKGVHGPHMWYGAMKFLLPTGLNLPFQGMAMVGAPYILLTVAIGYFALRKSETIAFSFKKSDLAAALCLGVLVSTSPVHGLIMAIAFSLFLLYKRGVAGILPIAATGLLSATVAASFIFTVAGKGVAQVGGKPLIGFSGEGLLTFGLMLVGFLPLIAAAFASRKELEKDTLALSAALMLSSITILFTLNLGYLYFTYPLLAGLCILASPYFAKAFGARSLLPIAILALLCIPNLLIIGSYVYYRAPLDANEVEASRWLAENSPENSTAMGELFLGENYSSLCPSGKPRDVSQLQERQFAYVPAFGNRKVFLADLRSLYVYGENFCPELSVYFGVFEEKDAGVVCSLKGFGVDYVYSKGWNPPAGAEGCLEKVYGQEGVTIYATR